MITAKYWYTFQRVWKMKSENVFFLLHISVELTSSNLLAYHNFFTCNFVNFASITTFLNFSTYFIKLIPKNLTNQNISLDSHCLGMINLYFPVSVSSNICLSMHWKFIHFDAQSSSLILTAQPWHNKLANAWIWITILYRFTLELSLNPPKHKRRKYQNIAQRRAVRVKCSDFDAPNCNKLPQPWKSMSTLEIFASALSRIHNSSARF